MNMLEETSQKPYVNGTCWPRKIPRSKSGFRQTAASNIAAIDFGTTSCSVAFCHRGDKDNVHLLKLDRIHRRVPTSILINDAGQVVEFGRKARMEYARQSPEKKKGLYYFNEIKMNLHHDSCVQWNYTVKAMNYTEFFLVEVIAMILKHLKEKLLEVEGRGIAGSLKATNFEWVITVPAIWKSRGKQMMREAAYKAGLTSDDAMITTLTKVQRQSGRLIVVPPPVLETHNPELLSLVLEPEVAAVHCKKVANARGVKCADSKSYMVVDVGGGTVDITAHTVTTTGAIDVVLPPTGNDWGGTRVNAAFKEFLGKLVDDPQFHKFIFPGDRDPMKTASNSATLDEIVHEVFEDQKQDFGEKFVEKSDRRVVVRLPYKFMQTYGDTLESIEKTTLQQLDCEIYGEELQIHYSRMEEFFRSAVKKILKCLNRCFLKLGHVRIDTVFLVGGFGGCKYLHQKIEEELLRSHSFDPKSIFHTDDHELAVVLGAIAFQQNPSVIQSRIADATYGTGCCRSFDPAIHDRRYLFYDDDRVTKCNHLFTPFVHKGDVVFASVVLQKEYCPVSHNQTCMRFDIYSSSMHDIFYTCLPDGKELEGVRKIGTLTVKMPIAEGDKQRRVNLTIDFTRTEIQIQAYDIKSGEKVTTVIDFLRGDDLHTFQKLEDSSDENE